MHGGIIVMGATTRSASREQCPADPAERHFSAFRPNQLWAADMTHARTMSGWVYVAFVTDVCSRRVVGWQTSTSLYTDLVLDALRMAIWQCRREGADLTELVHHSDRGVQYRASVTGRSWPRPTRSPRSDQWETPTTTRWPRPSTPCTGPRRSAIATVSMSTAPGGHRRRRVRHTAEWVHWYNTVRSHFVIGMRALSSTSRPPAPITR